MTISKKTSAAPHFVFGSHIFLLSAYPMQGNRAG